jgi:Holliday junction resolvase RusA-like endonuclease
LTQEISFTIEADPVPASRPKIGRGVAYYPKKHTMYAEFLRKHLKEIPAFNHTGPLEVRLLFVMPRYKTSESVTHRADLDNLSKLPLDSMSKCLDEETEEHRFWVDDHMIVHLTALKRFTREGEQPHTRVLIRTLDGTIEDHVDRVFDS